MQINKDKCTKCGLCAKSCLREIIDIEKGVINEEKCMFCSHCLAVCPVDAISHNDQTGIELSDHNITPEQFRDLVYERKSIRNYTKEEIDQKILLDIADIARYAPTATNSQLVYVTIISGVEKVNTLADKVMNFYMPVVGMINGVTRPFFRLLIGRDRIRKVMNSKKYISRYKKGENILTFDAPALMIFHSPKQAIMPDADCNIAAQTAMLYAQTLGLGSCYNGFIVNCLQRSKKISSSVGIPRDHKVYESFTLGYPVLNYKKRVIKKELKADMIT